MLGLIHFATTLGNSTTQFLLLKIKDHLHRQGFKKRICTQPVKLLEIKIFRLKCVSTSLLSLLAKIKCKMYERRPGEMAQQLRVLAAFSGQVQFSVPTGQLTTIHNSSSRAYDTIFWLLPAPGMHMYTDICAAKIFIHINLN